ncbi:MAG TPA: trigger factor [Burkholderiales bacterium]|nr:trigger factor [Burkholderiales bacterium]
MAANVETLGALARRVSMTVPLKDVEQQVDARLKKLARDVRMPGFRPGKVPMKLIAQTYGPQVRSEVLGETVQKSFNQVVREANLKVAGYPKIEPKNEKQAPEASGALEFDATFEVFPEVKVGDIAGKSIERPAVGVSDAEVDKTIEILRKQRQRFVAASRAAQDGDRLVIDFAGTIDGVPFEGGRAEGFALVLGEGRLLPEFEAGARGMAAGETKNVDVKFPDDYQGKDVAGKKAVFAITVKSVEQPELPALDAAFAKQLGVADGDLAKMRTEVKANVEREVKKRVDARVKQQVLQALLDATPLELPKSLIEMETQELAQRAVADLQQRGLRPEQMPPVEPKMFEETATRRVALGLIINELAQREGLKPKPAEVRELVEQEAQSYENPAEVVKWFYMQPQRLSEMESAALEANVVKWVLSKAQVNDKQTPFDELMGAQS